MHNLYMGQIFCGLAMVSQNVSTKLSTENVDKLSVNFIVQKSYSYRRISLFSTHHCHRFVMNDTVVWI